MSTTDTTASVGTVLITGAGAGIGRATARRFAQAHWRCVLVDANLQSLDALGAELDPAGAAGHIFRQMDLTDLQQIDALAQVLPAHGVHTLDALINNAGMSHAGASALEPLGEGMAARLLALNLMAPARMVQACTPLLRPGARIVNLASGAALRAIPQRGLYSPSKAGVLAQTAALAQAHPEWTVTSLAPGYVRTELVQKLLDGGQLDPAQALAKVPLGRMAEPWEMAEALFFLASEGARPLSGQCLSVCGGSSVFGGSQTMALADLACLSADTPLALQLQAQTPSASWLDLAQALTPSVTPASGGMYPAVLDGSALDAPAGGLLKAVQSAASRFASAHLQQASLTLLLPVRTVAWQHAGDAAAAHMLIATLAVEWGGRALRINALEVGPDGPASTCAPLIRYMAGPAAQYLTGQTLHLLR